MARRATTVRSKTLFDPRHLDGAFDLSDKLVPPVDIVRRRLDAVDWDFPEHVPNQWTSGIHGLHWYPAPFPPGLAATLTDILCPASGTVLDPFMGSGVGLLEAWLRRRRVVGVDINQFAIDLATTKFGLLINANQSDAKRLVNEYERHRKDLLKENVKHSLSDLCGASEIQPEAMQWFDDGVLREIAVIKQWLDECLPERKILGMARRTAHILISK